MCASQKAARNNWRWLFAQHGVHFKNQRHQIIIHHSNSPKKHPNLLFRQLGPTKNTLCVKKKTQNISHFWSACINTGEGGGERFHVASRKKEGRWRPLQWLHSLARSFSLCRKSVCGYRWNRATGHFTFQLNSQNGMSLCPANQRRIYTPHLCIPNNHNYFHCSLLHQCMLPFYCFIHCRSIKKL